MRFLTLVSSPPNQGMPPESLWAEIERRAQVAESKHQLVTRGGLKPNMKAYRVGGGALSVTDGPFTESKEVVGGFAIVEFPTREDALRDAKEFAEMHRQLWPEGQVTLTVHELFDPDGE
jgi:hypothetical protein